MILIAFEEKLDGPEFTCHEESRVAGPKLSISAIADLKSCAVNWRFPGRLAGVISMRVALKNDQVFSKSIAENSDISTLDYSWFREFHEKDLTTRT